MGDIEVSLAGQLVVAALSQPCNLSHVRGRELEGGQERGKLVVGHVSIQKYMCMCGEMWRRREESECKKKGEKG